MGFRLLANNALDFDTLEEALAAQEAKQRRLEAQHQAPPVAPPPPAQVGHSNRAAVATKTAAPAQSAKRKTPPADRPTPAIRRVAINWSSLGELGAHLSDRQKAILISIAERDEVTTRDIAALHPTAGTDLAKVMKNLRDAIAKAGFSDGEILIWAVSGWGSDKRSAYRAGPKLLAALLPGSAGAAVEANA